MDNLFVLAKRYSEKYEDSLSLTGKHLLDEFINKLKDLNDLNLKINNLLEKCIANSAIKFDSESNIVSFGDIKLELKRQDPAQKITMTNLGVGYIKSPLEDSFSSLSLQDSQKELERCTIQYYQIAHRIIKICQLMPHLRGFKCNEITLVRNKLIEHPEKEGGVVLDTFTYDTNNGPTIKGMRYSYQSKIFPSKGLRHDSFEFIRRLTERLNTALS